MSEYPHIGRSWTQRFIMEARAMDASGAAIGAALAEVESHCIASGERAEDAFGDPAEYARSLRFPAAHSRAWLIPSALVGAIGSLLVPQAARAFGRGSEAVLSQATIVMAVAGLVLAIALTAIRRPLYRWINRLGDQQTSVVSIVAIAVIVVGTGLAILIPDETLRVHPMVPALVGTVFLIVGAITGWRGLDEPDPVLDPISGRPTQNRTAQRLLALSLPTIAIVLSIAGYFSTLAR